MKEMKTEWNHRNNQRLNICSCIRKTRVSWPPCRIVYVFAGVQYSHTSGDCHVRCKVYPEWVKGARKEEPRSRRPGRMIISISILPGVFGGKRMGLSFLGALGDDGPVCFICRVPGSLYMHSLILGLNVYNDIAFT